MDYCVGFGKSFWYKNHDKTVSEAVPQAQEMKK
jgi:hypothetical protein